MEKVTGAGLGSSLQDLAARIREMREIMNLSVKEMAEKNQITEEQYLLFESGTVDFPFTFLYNCSKIFGIELTELMEGHSAHLSSYTVTRRGCGQETVREAGIEIYNLASHFAQKIAEPNWVRYCYSEEQQNKPIHLTSHSGQEFDLIIEGSLKVQVGNHTEVLNEGDSIYYNSSTPHGMIAVGKKDCVFVAVVLPGDNTSGEKAVAETLRPGKKAGHLLCEKFVSTKENENGTPVEVKFHDHERFNFAFDIVDEIGRTTPDKLAMIHLDREKNEHRYTFGDVKRASSQCANYFKSLGIKRGDRVMLVLKRHAAFWFSILGLHKLGAIAIPATNMLQEHDFEYRFNAAGVSAILCTADGDTAHQVDLAAAKSPTLKTKILVGGKREGWLDFNENYSLFSGKFERGKDAPGGDDTMLMFFTSGTTGYPKIAAHKYTYALAHFVTAKYWHSVDPDGLHLTISDTGWGKSLWGKLYGQWLCEAPVFVYDFDRFDAADILPLFAKYHITTFCAPPTMYRMMIKEDVSKYDLSSIGHATIAGEALNPEVARQFEKITGLTLTEAFGQTETTLVIGNLAGMPIKLGSMGKPSPIYDVDLMTPDGTIAGPGETGEIVIKTADGAPCGLFKGYFGDGGEELTREVWHDGYYHTGDVAWRDEDGYYWYVGRADDVIKSSGYRIGPFEIESVIMELPYVLECGVSAVPDEIRGQVVKASIVLTRGTEPTEALKKEIQQYVKTKTAPYKYPRIVEFRESLPKTISGKIIRNKL